MSSSSQRSAPPPDSAGGGIRRLLIGFAAAIAGFLGAGSLLLWALQTSGQAYGKVESDVVTAVTGHLARQMEYAGSPRLVYLGDSLSMPTKRQSITGQLRQMLERRRARQDDPVSILNVSAPGLTAFSHYFLSEELAALQADRFVISINLGWFDRGTDAQQPSMVGMLPVSRWPEAFRLPLYPLGISADEIVTARGVRAAGLFESWRAVQREQVRFRLAAKRTENAFNAAVGMPHGRHYSRRPRTQVRWVHQRGNRPTKLGARARLGSVLDGLAIDDPTLVVLDALVARLRATGARVLLMVPPTNVEALVEVDAYDRRGVQTSLDRIRQVAVDNDADFLDLHALLPDEDFLDATDHLRANKSRPAARVASQLVLWSDDEADWDRFRPGAGVLETPIER